MMQSTSLADLAEDVLATLASSRVSLRAAMQHTARLAARGEDVDGLLTALLEMAATLATLRGHARQAEPDKWRR